MMLSTTEENYLKAIFKIAERTGSPAGTNAIAAAMETTAASVTDMLKRLADKGLLTYEKYRGVQLTGSGELAAIGLIRRHRLWEVFLANKLGFAWDEVHDLAEQLEHVQGEQLTERLDQFLGYPTFDPHGDPIPNAQGQWQPAAQVLLSALSVGQQGIISGVDDHDPAFLQYLTQLQLPLGTVLMVEAIFPYDQSISVCLSDGTRLTLSSKVASNLYVKSYATSLSF